VSRGACFDTTHPAPPQHVVVLRHTVGAVSAVIRQVAHHDRRRPSPASLSRLLCGLSETGIGLA
jgi:hypothetical protein